MVYTTLCCVFVLLSRTFAIPATPIATEPVLSTITISTVTQSLSTFESLLTETSTVFDVSARTTPTDGAVIASVTTLGIKSVELVRYTTTDVSAVSVTGAVVVVSTVGLTTIYAADVQTPTTTAGSPSILAVSASANSTTSNSSNATASSQLSQASENSMSGPTLLAEPSGGLSTGQKAGLGVGVPLGVVALVAAALLFLKWTKSGKTRATNVEGAAGSENDFASRPYKTQVERVPPIFQAARKPEQQTHPAYEMPNPRLSQPTEMSYNSLHPSRDDEPLYLGIPAHMSGAKRWSKEKQSSG